MIQKYISLPKELDQKIRERAKLLQAPEERVIRELIEQGLKTSKPMSLGEGLRKRATLGIKGPKDLSQNIDKYLYEEDEWEKADDHFRLKWSYCFDEWDRWVPSLSTPDERNPY